MEDEAEGAGEEEVGEGEDEKEREVGAEERVLRVGGVLQTLRRVSVDRREVERGDRRFSSQTTSREKGDVGTASTGDSLLHVLRVNSVSQG
jgi:hypothetical protein